MLRAAALAGAVILSASCSKSESTEGLGAVASTAGSGKASGGFSADLAKELAGSKPADSGPAAGAGAGGKSSAAGGDSKSSADGDSKSATAGGDGKSRGATVGDGTAGAATASDAKGTSTKAAATGGDPRSAGDAAASAGARTSTASAPTPAIAAPAAPRGPIKVSADLAAIKISLLPNWDRDIDEAGTFQYVVRVKGTQSTKTFTFRYGYEDAKAPPDRDQYKKYLQDTKTLTEIRDRQRGAAWFLEGNDAAGLPAFRYVVLYGGKRLICYGSLYKDAESNKLGDDRDQTVIQAKQICETLAL